MEAQQAIQYVWDGRLGDELLRFDEYCAVVEVMTDELEATI